MNIRQQPVHEWIFGQFLQKLKYLILRGVHNEYEFIEEENRLLATALRLVMHISSEPQNLRLIRELMPYFADIHSEPNPKSVWHLWQKHRFLLHYENIKPWTELIVFSMNLEWMQGHKKGMALLFNMNKLFEKYVAHCLSEKFKVKEQAQSKYILSNIEGELFFNLRPDLILNQEIIADCKWKLLNGNQQSDYQNSAFSISQNDLYQLGMYGVNYLDNQQGKLILFYPENENFKEPLFFTFAYNASLEVRVIPFPLEWNKVAAEKIADLIELDVKIL